MKSMSLQPTPLFMRQVVDTPPSFFVLSVPLCSVLQASAEVGEVLLHTAPTERTNSTRLLMSNKVQYRAALQRNPSVKLGGDKRNVL